VDAKIVALAADLLGRPDEARQYRELAVSIKAAFNARFYHRTPRSTTMAARLP